jgi:D-lactate dehydrogenase (cytochrome)
MAMTDDLVQRLSSHQVTTNASILEQHSHDESYHTPVLPDVVVYPESVEDVQKVVEYAANHGIPVIPFGVGSGLEGHVVPVKRGITLDMMRMNEVVEVRRDDFLVCVQPGVTRVQLNEVLKRFGLFFPVDPGANASLGGMAATNASGTTTVRYGAMKDNVRAAQVVLADGTVIRTGSLATKSSSGLNLTSLFVGSEGTLGIFTELWLKVYGIPEKIVAARAEFPDVERCVRAAHAMMGAGVPVARLELVTAPFIQAFNLYKQTRYTAVPTLFLEFHGNPRSVHYDVDLAREIAGEEGCAHFEDVTTEEDRNQLWEARHSAAYAFMHQYPGLHHMATDVCVPLSKLPEAVTHAENVLRESNVHGAIVGHVGDGNFHASLAVNSADPQSMAQAYHVNEQIVHHALAVGGTCTGEHGVGLGKRKYQEREHGPAIEVMRAIKLALDPGHILNPGKLVDSD